MEKNNPYNNDDLANNDDIDSDPFGLPELSGENAPAEYTVSEISQKLKHTVESEFSYVRIRGEVSRVTVAKSGHLYTSLKDNNAVLDAICWKGTLSRLSIKPEEGMEVVCTGRLTTYPGRSNYQLIIETMELAGQGALLKMLEDRRKKLEAEGLFDGSRKKKLPFIPNKIGVITSQTGAVIRDIMHRINERFPRPVFLYPVLVQGKNTSKTICEAIIAFNSLDKSSPHRPDILIIARGGGSLEDLMPFNDENIVREVAKSEIPIISAIGHETDTTLIDYAADLRAPTPTAAAEMAVPVRMELLTNVLDFEKRLISSSSRMLEQYKIKLESLARSLGNPQVLLETSMQKLDFLSSKLDMELKTWLQKKELLLKDLSAKLSPQNMLLRIENTSNTLAGHSERLENSKCKNINDNKIKLENISHMLESLSFERVLDRGYAVIFNEKDEIISSINNLSENQRVKIRLKDGKKMTRIEK